MGSLMRRGPRGVPCTIALCLSCAVVALIWLVTASPSAIFTTGKIPSVPLPGKSPPEPPTPHWVYKPTPSPKPPVTDHFPRAVSAKSASDLPPVPSWNTPPSPHVNESTPLFIGFTRTWALLQQCIVSYITAGWPPEDIYVVENTGTMDANRLGQLTLQNPFYIDYHRLTDVFGVNVLTTPTLFSFAQLQNFYIYTAISKGWDHFFWGHMDIAVLSNEEWKDPETGEYKSLYMRAVDDISEMRRTSAAPDDKGRLGGWALRFYAYDTLTLVNRSAYEHVGGWDTMIPYYGTDCDMHSRLFMSGFKQGDAAVGRIFDVAHSLEDLEIFYRRKPQEGESTTESEAEDTRGSPGWASLRDQLQELTNTKNSGDRLRWQGAQEGGQGEPYYRDSRGFQKALNMWIEHGKNVMAEKWGHRGCNLKGLKFTDAWLVEHDWK